MSFRKRITEILTPPSRHKSDFEELGVAGHQEIGGVARIGDILTRLLCDAGRGDEATRVELEELRKIAAKYGSYLTACEIQECVLRMPDVDEAGNSFKKGRGFELAADFHHQSLIGRIKGVGDGSLEVGPEEFSKYFSELLESFFSAKKHRKGIQVCLGICDDLVLRGCGVSRGAGLYPALAKESMVAMMDLALCEKEKTDRRFNRAKRDHRRFDTPMPEESAPPDSVDASLLAYVDGCRLQVTQVELGMGRVQGRVEVDFRALTGGESRDVFSRHLAYIELVRKVASGAQHQVLEAYAYEQASVVKEFVASGSGLELFGMGAGLLESRGASEVELSLEVLGRRHYEKSAELWLLAGDGSRAERARSIGAQLG